MTYRDRRLARADRLEEWGEKREQRSADHEKTARRIADGIPFGQPILVGHHSEGRARRDQARIRSGFEQAHENAEVAREHRSRADEIRRQAENAIYSDDPDAVDRLEEKIAELEATRASRKAKNDAYRKEHRAELKTMTAYERSQAVPYPSYSISNLTGRISTARQRLEQLRHAAAQRAGEAPVHYRQITARYAGSCDECGTAIARGDTIRYARNAPDGRQCLCLACP